jgi:uncharacterized protein (DUF1697 family)
LSGTGLPDGLATAAWQHTGPIPPGHGRAALTAAGLTEVRTCLQSGNILARSALDTAAEVSELVGSVIADEFALDVPVITRTPAEIDAVIAAGTCRIDGRHVYVDYVRGYHNTGRTAPWFTRALGVDGTERNWRTVLALAQLAAS